MIGWAWNVLVSAARGRSGAWSSGGVYVDGALKEEFGLAVLEALASGLAVVAPSTGGPSTYVAQGDTGVLVEPHDDLGVRHGHLALGREDLDERRAGLGREADRLLGAAGPEPAGYRLPGQ